MTTNTPTPTVKQIEAALNADSARIDRAEAILAEARLQFQNIVGGPESEAIRKARAGEFEPTLTKAERDAVNASNVALANIEQVLSQTGTSGPSLTADEMRDADSRKTFVREDVEELPLTKLVEQVRFALTKDDRATMFLFARYVPRRLSDTTGTWGDSGSDAEKTDLRRMLREIDGRLSDTTTMKPIAEKATALRSRAFKLEQDARKREMAAQTYGFQAEREVAW